MIHAVFYLLLTQPDVAAMKADARALADVKCADAAQCKAVPLGSKPCGGPTEFIVTCGTSKNAAALEAKAKAASAAEQRANEKEQRMGTCTALTPPAVKLEGGKCTAAAPKPADVPM